MEDKTTKYDAILLCDGMTMLELIRAITIMPADAVLRLPAVGDDKVIRLRAEFTKEDRQWMQRDTMLELQSRQIDGTQLLITGSEVPK